MVERWLHPESLGSVASRVGGIVPRGAIGADLHARLPDRWTFRESDDPVAALSAALAAAGADDVPLLVLLGPVDVAVEALGVLRGALDRDPMFGSALPRIACQDRCCFARLRPHGLGATDWLPREVLADLPEEELLVETAAPCMLVSAQLAGNFGPLDPRFRDAGAAIVHFHATARRCGFRTVLCNRAVVGIDGLACSAPPRGLPMPSAPDDELLRRLVPDFENAWRELRGGSGERFERLCTAAFEASAARPSLLLDVRNVGAMFNGTTQAVLGIVTGLKSSRPAWDVALLASAEGAAFHGLARRCVDWPVYTTMPDRPFTAAVRLSQPWHIQEMIDLHRLSLFNAYLMLDTIAWDIGYASAQRLEGTWQFMADHADGFLFDSDFTRQRFLERFAQAASVPGRVVHLSFAPAEHSHRGAARNGGDPFILVVGNAYEHKDVNRTVEVLASAFPFKRIQTLGPADVASPFVTVHHSGKVADEDVHRLYANAQFVVFPSFYEGFGFPMLTALAYGRTVLARRSPLVDEVAAGCVPNGRLVLFSRREELAELIGRMLHGEGVPEQPLGSGLDGRPPKAWRDVAADTLAFIEHHLRVHRRTRWIARERAVQQVLAYQR